MNILLRTIRRRPFLQIVLLVAFVLVISGGILLVKASSRLPEKIWLPEGSKYTTDDELVYDLPVTSAVVNTKYGSAVRYESVSDHSEYDLTAFTTLYEFRSSPLLIASFCPNIARLETLSPSGCKRLGTVRGVKVYTMQRSLPSGTTEYFANLAGTFVFMKQAGDGGESLDYFKSLMTMRQGQTAAYLSANDRRVQQVLTKRADAKVAVDRASALAYTFLDFSPAIPQTLPDGWLKPAMKNVEIDGPDATHPKLVNVNYEGVHKQYLSVHSGKLSDFTLGQTCGPTPQSSMEYLPCTKVFNTNYYEAVTTNSYGDYGRYLYVPIGDKLVISNIHASPEEITRPDWLAGLIKAQDNITLSSQPVDKNTLKGSKYYKLFY